ncbi:toll/interleukin-1 receptor domain-containing protein [Belliella filtrata]|uniref:toll/interleukin-1 receptor domain-containing protein n=1 Tax=Belliella filtrata TaxID=2923435 RepID=UPI00293F5EF4|nr:toll/interleukin-1 receptor domain-containing protein [Belliella filtrata]
MSIDNIARQIVVVDREINTIEKSIHSINGIISRKSKEAHNVLTKISREKDLKRVLTFQKEVSKKNEEISKLEKDKTNKSKTLAAKKKKKHDLQSKLNNEEQKGRDKAKKEQKEILTLQQQITREMEKQKMQSIHSFDVLKKPQPIDQTNYDVFVSHASEDKDEFVRDFVKQLQENGLKVWYDEFTLRVGDSLRRSIDNGLRNSRYGIVVLSEAFFSKEWPQRELDGLFAREVNGEKVILPIWHKISKNEVMEFSPIIADMLALNTSSFTIEEIAKEISDRVLH